MSTSAFLPVDLMHVCVCFYLIVPGVCHDGWWDPHLQAGADQAGGLSLHVPVESRHRGGARGHVVFSTPL